MVTAPGTDEIVDDVDGALGVLGRIFGYDAFRGNQREIIEHVIGGGDALVLMPTGGGKSLCYQIPALVRDGVGVVVSPLIALMQDQVDALRALGVRAGFLNSSQAPAARREVETAFLNAELDLLYLAPESLGGGASATMRLLERGRIALFAIDEAHCVAQWGHDFRPDYLALSMLHERWPQVPRIALTATATSRTHAEIADRLNLGGAKHFVASFDRPNIQYRIVAKNEPRKQLLDLLRTEHSGDAGIVYCLSRASVDKTAEFLVRSGIPALPYHAGLDAGTRAANQSRFLREDGLVMVATIAFGMGIDKPDVRFVVHAEVSDSLDSYYQEIGRAGRDGEPALAVLCYRSEDLGLRNFFASGGSDPQVLTTVAGAVRRHTRSEGAVEPSVLKDELELSHTRLTNAVNLLEQAGAIDVDGDGRLHYTHSRLAVGTAVSQATEAAEAHTRVDRSRVEMMRGYAETSGCRRQFLLGYFGENLPRLCGNCDPCSSGSAAGHLIDLRESSGPAASGPGPFALNAQVEHREWGRGVVMRHEPDRITVLFEQVGYRTLALAALRADDGLLVVVQNPA